MGKKLLIVSQRFWPEENDINTLADAFARRGVKVDVLCGRPNYPAGKYFKGYRPFGRRREKYGFINVYRAFEFQRGGSLGERPLLNYLSFFISSFFRLRTLSKNRYDAVFVYQTSPVFQGTAAVRMAKRKGIRSCMYVYDLWPDAFFKEMDIKDPLLKKLFRGISKRCYRSAFRLVTGSEDVRRYLIREVVSTPEKVAYVAPFSSEGCEVNGQDMRIRQRFIGSFNAVYIGEIEKDGPCGLFLDAAQHIIAAGYPDVRFILVGYGSGLEALRRETEKRGLFDMVYFEGKPAQNRTDGYLNAADVLICADKPDISLSYKAPKKIIDYMAAGKPIAAAVDSEGKKLIKKSGCGLACESDDAEGLAENIIRLYKTPKEELEDMGRRAKLYQLKNFNFETCVEKMLDIIFSS